MSQKYLNYLLTYASISGIFFFQASLHWVFVCKTHIFSSLNSKDVLWKKTFQLRIGAKILDSKKNVKKINKAYLIFSRLSELSWLKSIIMRALQHWENKITCCQEMLWRLVVTINTYFWLGRFINRFYNKISKSINYNLILVEKNSTL